MRIDAVRPGATRRGALFGGLCLCCLPTLGRSAEAFALSEVGPGIFVRRGADAEATAENADAIANIGFIVGARSVLVTESGGSLADGAWLRGEIAKRTDKPISHVVLTHVHPDHCFGAAAFAEDKPVYVGHHALRAALDARGAYYRARLVEILGEEKAGRVVYPTLEVTDGAEVDLGGRTLRFTAHGAAHTNCDLSMRDSASGILFPADLLFVTRIPSLDGSLVGWLKEVERLRASGAAKAVPGHGPHWSTSRPRWTTSPATSPLCAMRPARPSRRTSPSRRRCARWDRPSATSGSCSRPITGATSPKPSRNWSGSEAPA